MVNRVGFRRVLKHHLSLARVHMSCVALLVTLGARGATETPLWEGRKESSRLRATTYYCITQLYIFSIRTVLAVDRRSTSKVIIYNMVVTSKSDKSDSV